MLSNIMQAMQYYTSYAILCKQLYVMQAMQHNANLATMSLMQTCAKLANALYSSPINCNTEHFDGEKMVPLPLDIKERATNKQGPCID